MQKLITLLFDVIQVCIGMLCQPCGLLWSWTITGTCHNFFVRKSRRVSVHLGPLFLLHGFVTSSCVDNVHLITDIKMMRISLFYINISVKMWGSFI